jgi:hypothetical protein
MIAFVSTVAPGTKIAVSRLAAMAFDELAVRCFESLELLVAVAVLLDDFARARNKAAPE